MKLGINTLALLGAGSVQRGDTPRRQTGLWQPSHRLCGNTRKIRRSVVGNIKVLFHVFIMAEERHK